MKIDDIYYELIKKMSQQVVDNYNKMNIVPGMESVEESKITDLIDTLVREGKSVIIASMPFFHTYINDEFITVSIKTYKVGGEYPLEIGDSIKTVFLYQWSYIPETPYTIIRFYGIDTEVKDKFPKGFLSIKGDKPNE